MISHSTAKQMAELGFPQPEPKFGQMWYDDKGRICVFMKLVGDVGNWKLAGAHGLSFQESPKWYIYAPTVADIMRELYHVMTPIVFFENNVWTVGYPAGLGVIEPICNDKDPEEALAKAWIEKQRKAEVC